MVFKRMLKSLGVGGPSVDTVLASPHVRPGERITGEVRVEGGEHEVDIDYVALGLVTRVEAEHGDSEHSGTVEFFRADVSGPFRLRPGERRAVPFGLPIPWETPITEIHGRHLHGMTMGVRTELAVAKAIDKSDLDAISVHPLPVQERLLEAFGALGFRFRGADLEMGRLHGVHQRLPFFQEIEFLAPPQYARRINEVELTFVAAPEGIEIVLEADKRGGMFSSGHDAFGRFRLTGEQALQTDWAAELGRWLDAVADRRRHHPPHRSYGGHGHHGGAGGALVAGAAAGFFAAEVADEIGDFLGGDGGGFEGGGDFGGGFDGGGDFGGE